jgi:hypothetical protein
MQVIIEKATETIRRVISVGVDNFEYALADDQERRVIADEDWVGLSKDKVEWDEAQRKLIPKRQATADRETEDRRQQDVNRKIGQALPDMLRRQISWSDVLAEAKAIDDASKG